MGIHDPDVCVCCGRHAIGIGFEKPLRWICQECLPLIDHIKNIKRWSPYEVKALDAVDNATSDYAAEHGADLAAYDDDQRRGLWLCAIKAHQNEIRRLVRDDEAPF